MVEDQDEQECKDEFFSYLLKQGYLLSTETQVDSELIMMLDADTLVNEGIILEDTGINVRSSEEQSLIDRIKLLE